MIPTPTDGMTVSLRRQAALVVVPSGTPGPAHHVDKMADGYNWSTFGIAAAAIVITSLGLVISYKAYKSYVLPLYLDTKTF
jgi:hypothetical protein